MGKVPIGILLIQEGCHSPGQRTLWYKIFILFFTFFIYASYHLSRKPISVVKSVLNPNCTNPNGTDVNPTTGNVTCGWPPFNGPNAKELLGSLDTAYLFPYAIGMFISGHIAERVSLRLFLGAGMLLSGGFTILFGMARYWNIHSLGFFIAVQVIGGFVQATGWPSVVTCVANWFGKGKRGLIMGIWNSHTSVGNILGSVIAGAFVSYNWGLSFIVPGIIICVMGVLVLLFLVPCPEYVGCDSPNPPPITPSNTIQVEDDSEYIATPSNTIQVEDDSEYMADEEEINNKEQEPLLSDDSDSGKPDPDQVQAVSFWRALRIPGVIEFSLCLFFAKLVSYTFLYWLPSYITASTTYDPEIAADLSTLFDLGGIVGGIVAGVVSDISDGRAITCLIMLILAAPALFLYQAFGSINLPINIVLLLVCGFLVNGPYALITTAVSADLGTHSCLQGNAKALATVTAIIDGTGSLGAAVGPLLAGVISPSGWSNVFYMLIASDIAAMVFLVRLVFKEFTRWRYRRLQTLVHEYDR